MNYRICVTLATLALLASCGSSNCFAGSCSSTLPPTGGGPGASGLMEITADNALPALREAWFAMTTTADLPAFVVGTGIGDTSGGVAKIGVPIAQAASRNTVYVDPFGPTTYNCPVSGTFIVSGDVTDPNTVTAGDFVNYQSSACDSGTGYTVDGTHSLDIIAIDGDVASGQFEQAQTLTFTDFQAASSVVTSMNGDHTAVIDSRPADLVTTSFSGNSLVVNESGITISISNFSGFASLQTISPFAYTLTATGSGNSSVIQGSFDYNTDELIQQDGGPFPFDGILDIYGDNNGTARVAIFDGASVVIQVDANGSDNYEVSTQITWEEFLGL